MYYTNGFIEDVALEALAGLTSAQKTLPAKLLYDDEGCRLFDAITRLPEYYITRTERGLLGEIAHSIFVPPHAVLVEYGASDESKASTLLETLEMAAYVPIDIAASALTALQRRMAVDRPEIAVYPMEADFLGPLTLPKEVAGLPKLGFFPGSTIGNLDPHSARAFLRQVKRTLGRDAFFLVGADLRKDAAILVPAYDDPQGVTAAFNLNLLARLNREAAADFDLNSFQHRAIWNETSSRIEMHLQSKFAQKAMIAGQTISFEAGETIHTENSYKHTLAGLATLATAAGWKPVDAWMDPAGLFSLQLFHAVG